MIPVLNFKVTRRQSLAASLSRWEVEVILANINNAKIDSICYPGWHFRILEIMDLLLWSWNTFQNCDLRLSTQLKLGLAINKLDIILKTSRIFLSEAPIEVDLVAPVVWIISALCLTFMSCWQWWISNNIHSFPIGGSPINNGRTIWSSRNNWKPST